MQKILLRQDCQIGGEVQLAYAIGIAEPVSLYVNTFGTNKIPENQIEELVTRNFDMRPSGIVSELNLKRPIYKKTASYGHFGRNEPEFTWEKTGQGRKAKAGCRNLINPKQNGISFYLVFVI